MDKAVVYQILDHLGNRLRPRNLYTSNWLGTGRLDWSEQKREDDEGDGWFYRFSVAVDHVISSPIMQVCPGELEIGFYEDERKGYTPIKIVLDIRDPDFFEKLSVFSWEKVSSGRLEDSRLHYGPKEGFKPVVWRPCRVAAYPWKETKDWDKAIFAGIDIAI